MSGLTRKRLGPSAVEVTSLGLGGAALGNLYEEVADVAAHATVAAALDSGVRYFDTAPYYGYGLSESRLGQALEKTPRGEIVLSTKVGRLLVPRLGKAREDQGFVAANAFDPVFDYSYDGVMRSFESSLLRLGTDRIDVLLMHDIGAMTHGADRHREIFDAAMEGGARAMDELRKGGAVAAVGLGVNECAVCIEAMEHFDFDCFLLAGRYTLLEQGALDTLLPACVERGVSLIVGGPFNSGVLAEKEGTPVHFDYTAASAAVVAKVSQIRAVCAAHGVPLAAAALQFPVLHPAVACVIPGARNESEVIANVRNMACEIPAGLWRDLVAEGLLRPDAPVGGPT